MIRLILKKRHSTRWVRWGIVLFWLLALAPITSAPVIHSAELPPAVPVNVRATDGSYSGMIEINWDQPASYPAANYWLVFRSEENDVNTAVQVDYSSNTRSISMDVVPGVIYYFWVQACSAYGICSDFSEPDSGFAKVASSDPPSSNPSVPVNVQATDGTDRYLIVIEWRQPDNGESVNHWRVFRSEENDVNTAIQVDQSSNTRSFSDDVDSGVIYYFWVQACRFPEVCSDYSAPDTGYFGTPPPATDNVYYLPCILR
jgi:hypothetical protein